MESVFFVSSSSLLPLFAVGSITTHWSGFQMCGISIVREREALEEILREMYPEMSVSVELYRTLSEETVGTDKTLRRYDEEVHGCFAHIISKVKKFMNAEMTETVEE